MSTTKATICLKECKVLTTNFAIIHTKTPSQFAHSSNNSNAKWLTGWLAPHHVGIHLATRIKQVSKGVQPAGLRLDYQCESRQCNRTTLRQQNFETCKSKSKYSRLQTKSFNTICIKYKQFWSLKFSFQNPKNNSKRINK